MLPGAEETAKKIVDAAFNKQAADILLLDVREDCSFADYFVLCTAESERQVQAIFDEIDATLSQEGISTFRREGSADSGWVLVDIGDVIVHIFAPQMRQYYGLEELRKGFAVLRIL